MAYFLQPPYHVARTLAYARAAGAIPRQTFCKAASKCTAVKVKQPVPLFQDNRSTHSTEPALSECSSISFSCPSSSRHGRRQRRRVTNPAGNPDSDDAADAKRQRGIQLQLWKRICDGQHRLDRNIGDKEWRLQVCKAFMASLRQVGTSSTITIVVDRFVELPPSETIGPWKFRHSTSLEASGWW